MAKIYTHKLRLKADSDRRASARLEMLDMNWNRSAFLSENAIIPVPPEPSNNAQHFNYIMSMVIFVYI